MSRLVCGIGFNDNKYLAKTGSKITAEYTAWASMLRRCKESTWVRQPTYTGTTCSENFKSYSFFYEWCQEQVGFGDRDVNGNKWQLDKDLLLKGNKHYSEDTCVFVPPVLNLLLSRCSSSTGEFPLGVSWSKAAQKYIAQCGEGKKNKSAYIGVYTTVEEAFLAYKTLKEIRVKQVAEEYKNKLDTRTYAALMKYEANIND